jgi:hypothetical protein
MTQQQEPVSEALRRLTARSRPEADGGRTKQQLYERAKELDIDGRSNMSKEELAEAIAKRQ